MADNLTYNTRAYFIEAAKDIVCNDRENQYGKPEDNFERIANLWSAYLGPDFDPTLGFTSEDVAIMMTLLKIARIRTGKVYKADSWVDAIGYLACGGEIAARDDATIEAVFKQFQEKEVGEDNDRD